MLNYLFTSKALKDFVLRLHFFLNMAILFCSLGLFFFVVYHIYNYLKQAPQKIPISYNDNHRVRDLDQNKLMSFDYYQSQFEKKNFFKIPSFLLNKNEQTPNEYKIEDQSTIKLQSLIKNLTLVGIFMDQSPVAVIENTETQESLFLSVGDHIGDAFVKEIQSKKIILQYKEHTIEIIQ